MIKLYYDNQYLRAFTAEVIEVKQKQDEYHLLLDQTAFYPGGGGQPHDRGWIEGNEVVSVYEEHNKIYHVVKRPINKIHKLKCEIDWEYRFDKMQQHLAQHILSAALFKLFNASTLSFHLGDERCTIDINVSLETEQLIKAEAYANEIIHDRIDLNIYYPNAKELRKLPIQKDRYKHTDNIRIVQIDELDINPCGGLHPHSTIEVQMIKITKVEKNRQNLRIEFLSGARATKDYLNKFEFFNTVSKQLQCSDVNVAEKINHLFKEKNELMQQVNIYKQKIIEYRVSEYISSAIEYKSVKLVSFISYMDDIKTMSLITSKLAMYDNMVILVAVTNDDSINLIFKCSENLTKLNMNELLKDAITLVNGRGGGTRTSAQGGGKNNNNLDSLLNYSINQVKNTL